MRASRSACLGLLVLVACVVVPAAQTRTRSATTWVAHKTGASTFAGTYTNDSGAVVTGVSFGTAVLAQNPIVTFVFNGSPCPLYTAYGSAYCYLDLSLPVGAVVPFSGSTQLPITVGEKLTGCDSPNVGVSNRCIDFTVTAASSPPPTTTKPKLRQEIKTKLLDDVQFAIEHEGEAITELRKGAQTGFSVDLSGSIAALNHAIELLDVRKYIGGTIDLDLEHARDLDRKALDLYKGKPPKGGRLKQAIRWIDDATDDKKSAYSALQDLPAR